MHVSCHGRDIAAFASRLFGMPGGIGDVTSEENVDAVAGGVCGDPGVVRHGLHFNRLESGLCEAITMGIHREPNDDSARMRVFDGGC